MPFGREQILLSSRGQTRAFSLIEVMFATAIVSLLFLATTSALYMHRVQTKKYQERAIVLDFATHYLEHARGLPFEDLQIGNPINPLYDGSNGAPNIRIPANADWAPLDTEDFETFHPELVLLEPRSPQISVELTTTLSGGIPKSKHLRLRVRWDSPLGKGETTTTQMDLTRYADV